MSTACRRICAGLLAPANLSSRPQAAPNRHLVLQSELCCRRPCAACPAWVTQLLLPTPKVHANAAPDADSPFPGLDTSPDQQRCPLDNLQSAAIGLPALCLPWKRQMVVLSRQFVFIFWLFSTFCCSNKRSDAAQTHLIAAGSLISQQHATCDGQQTLKAHDCTLADRGFVTAHV